MTICYIYRFGKNIFSPYSIQTCVPYWPEKVNAQLKYGNVEVELLSLSHEEFLVVRDLKVTEQTSRVSYTLCIEITKFETQTTCDNMN